MPYSAVKRLNIIRMSILAKYSGSHLYSCSGGRNRKDGSWRTAWTKQLRRLYLNQWLGIAIGSGVHEPIIPANLGNPNRRAEVQNTPGIKLDSISKLTKAKGLGVMPQMVECLPSQNESKSNPPSTNNNMSACPR